MAIGELQTSSFDETAASNTEFPEGMAPSAVNDRARELMASIKRWFNRMSGLADAGTLISSAGTSPTFTVDYDTAPASLYTGLMVCFKAGADFGADSTVNVNSLGAVNVQKITASGYTNIVAGDIEQGQHVLLKYDGTLAKWVMMTPVAGAAAAFSDPMTTRGDIIVRNASNVTARLAVGAAETLLTSDGNDAAWADKRASAAEFRTGTSETKYLTPDKVFDAMAEVSLSDGATIALDLATGFDFTVTLAGNRTLGNPTNVKVGQRGRIRVVQDGTGSRTLAYGTNYEFESASAPTLSTAAAAEDILYYDCISATRILLHFIGAIG